MQTVLDYRDSKASRICCAFHWKPLGKTLPMAFRIISKTLCMVDCTEIFIDRTSDFKAQCQTWSKYKQHNRMKIIIAVTPEQYNMWKNLDKYITEHCSILDELFPGDLVAAH